MITYCVGNILESKAQALVNTVNTVGVMGKGLALQFKEAFPDNYNIYRRICKAGQLHPGQMLITEIGRLDCPNKYIVNFPTKTDWRKPSEYIYIKDGLKALRNEIEHRKISSIAIPPLGSRNGGLDWKIVKEMIVAELKDIECQIYIYQPSEDIVEKMKDERVELTPARAMMLDVMVDMVAHGEFVSEFAAEKIAYFLQRFGASDVFKLSYKRGVYGPYSGKVRYVLHYINGSYIMGMSDLSKRPFEEIMITPSAAEDVKNILCKPENIRYKEISDKTKLFLSGYYSSYSLELLSTVDFLLQSELQLKSWQSMPYNKVLDILVHDISQWNERKQRLFAKRQYVDIMLRHCSSINQ